MYRKNKIQYKVTAEDLIFFTKLLVKNLKGDWINEITTLRRVHSETISGKLEINSLEWKELVTEIKYITFKETQTVLSRKAKIHLLNWCIRYTIEMAAEGRFSKYFWQIIYSMFSEKFYMNCCNLILAHVSFRITGRGYIFAKNARIE